MYKPTPPSGPLTERQHQVLKFIRDCVAGDGLPPTRAEIAQALGFSSPNAAEQHVKALVNKGVLEWVPGASRGLRLVGVEFIVLAGVWESQHPGAGPPALEGHLLNLVDAPNRYGLPAFYEMHVWAWEHNPVGSFADWNTHVSCEQQPSP